MSQSRVSPKKMSRAQPGCQISAQSVQPFSRYRNGVCTCARAEALQKLPTGRGEKILLLAYARSCQHMGESETAINAAPRAVSELRKSNFIPRELSSFLKESVKTAHFNLIAASL